ncbi:HD family hydrolase [uncultured Gemmiger sp.]|uniref:HD domain-containing protein n=1 Tax=uncultured Gemmiger sp. TaxID=1623490 RepID=UPI0026335FBD|nr:HD domain-containing protein [uncultured Gemmiger sp.]
MEPLALLQALHTAEKLKDTTRHCYTSGGRHESVAEHSWRIALMAYWIRDEFPDADMDKVIRMCLIHDLGECFTGDIPAFDKTAADEAKEENLLYAWVATLPAPYNTEMRALETQEAKIYKALDKMEAVVSHNESDIATWEPQEYSLNLTYGVPQTRFAPYMQKLRETLKQETLHKMAENGKEMP